MQIWDWSPAPEHVKTVLSWVPQIRLQKRQQWFYYYRNPQSDCRYDIPYGTSVVPAVNKKTEEYQSVVITGSFVRAVTDISKRFFGFSPVSGRLWSRYICGNEYPSRCTARKSRLLHHEPLSGKFDAAAAVWPGESRTKRKAITEHIEHIYINPWKSVSGTSGYHFLVKLSRLPINELLFVKSTKASICSEL